MDGWDILLLLLVPSLVGAGAWYVVSVADQRNLVHHRRATEVWALLASKLQLHVVQTDVKGRFTREISGQLQGFEVSLQALSAGYGHKRAETRVWVSLEGLGLPPVHVRRRDLDEKRSPPIPTGWSEARSGDREFDQALRLLVADKESTARLFNSKVRATLVRLAGAAPGFQLRDNSLRWKVEEEVSQIKRLGGALYAMLQVALALQIALGSDGARTGS